MSKKNRGEQGSEATVDEATVTAQAPPTTKETKAAKFARLANRRVPAAIARLKQVQNLANRGQYERTQEQTSKLLDAIGVAHKALVAAFSDAPVAGASGPMFS